MQRRWASVWIITLVGVAVLSGLPSAQALTMKECSAKYEAAQQGGTLQGMFPTAVSPKYAHESPGKARLHTCLDQYNAGKSNNTLGGLKWIEKGGGYYGECNKRLKG
jgi:hypothetical protein